MFCVLALLFIYLFKCVFKVACTIVHAIIISIVSLWLKT